MRKDQVLEYGTSKRVIILSDQQRVAALIENCAKQEGVFCIVERANRWVGCSEGAEMDGIGVDLTHWSELV